jgi:hypothetical protein
LIRDDLLRLPHCLAELFQAFQNLLTRAMLNDLQRQALHGLVARAVAALGQLRVGNAEDDQAFRHPPFQRHSTWVRTDSWRVDTG